MTSITKILAIAVFVAVSACGKEVPTDPVCTVNCNPQENIDGAITSPTNNAVLSNGNVTLSASATSSLTGPITDGSKYVWTANGSQIGTGNNINVFVAPGSYNLCVTVSGKNTEKQFCGVSFTRMSTISVKVSAAVLGNQPLFSGIRITISSLSGSVKDSVDVAPDGTATFSGEVAQNLLALDNVRIVVDDISISRTYWRRQYAATKAEVANGLAFVLIPTTWVTTSGEYAGQTVAIDPAKPFIGDIKTGYHFYDSGWSGCTLGAMQCGVASWPTLPAPIAFMQGWQGGAFWGYTELATASDSATLWSAINRMTQLFGGPIVRAPNSGEIRNDGRGMIAVGIDSSEFVGTSAVALSSSAADSNRDIYMGIINFRNRQKIALSGAVMAEIMHATGAGHFCGATNSVTAINCAPGQSATAMEPTVEDVAYFWLLQAIRKQERAMNTHFSIVEN